MPVCIRPLLFAGCLLLLCGAPLPASSEAVPASLFLSYRDSLPEDLIDTSLNIIENTGALSAFFEQLRRLEGDSIRQVRIVHIGDSHIQADLLTGPLRGMLQHRFGAAGRGLVFPYSLAGTNCPLDLGFSSPHSWEARKSVFRSQGPPLGVSGISIRSTAAKPSLRLFLKDRYHYGHDYAFDRITIFHGPQEVFRPADSGEAPVEVHAGSRYHRVRSGDTLYELARTYGVTVDQLQRWNGLSGPRIQVGQQLIVDYEQPRPATAALSVLPAEILVTHPSPTQTQYTLPDPVRALDLRAESPPGGASTLFGMVLENTQSRGILYHVIGVNGVTYHHYNQSEHFWEQLPALQPDLIIVSLGTNEALAGGFDEAVFRTSVDRFLENARRAAPTAALLLTTNPDVLRRKRYDNPQNVQVREVIIAAANREGAAVWDLHRIMGGDGSVRRWRARDLAHTDFIHFTKEGYRLQAMLLYRALLNTYYAGN